MFPRIWDTNWVFITVGGGASVDLAAVAVDGGFSGFILVPVHLDIFDISG